jgi:DNA-binding Xre family transcriptional regulator
LWPTREKAATAASTSDEFTTLKDRKKEIGRDLLAKMCGDLKIDPHDL